MELFSAVAELLGSIAWPSAILVLVFLFRREIRQRLTSVTEVKYPGGSILMQEVERLEARVETVADRDERIVVALPRPHSDARLAIAQMRLDLEHELFLLARHALHRAGDSVWSVGRYLEELEKASELSSGAVDDIKGFVAIANSIIHGATLPDASIQRAVSVGGVLVAMLRRKRVVLEAERDFQGHLMWHLPKGEAAGADGVKHHFWSAVAGSLPDYQYDYDIYREAAERHFDRIERGEHPHDAFYILTLEDFVTVLEFREKELMRLTRSWSSLGWDKDGRALEWQWPYEWHIQWNGPILREKAHLWGAEEDLVRTRLSLDVYRQRLIDDRRRGAAG